MSEYCNDTDLCKNMNLVYKIASKFSSSISNSGAAVDFDDLVQELCIIWIRCAEKFDKDRGVRFSSYFYESAVKRAFRILKRENSKSWMNESIDALVNDDDISMMDVIQDIASPVPENEIEFISEIGDIAKSLSKEAAVMFEWMIDPPDELIAESKAKANYSGRRELINMGLVVQFATIVLCIPRMRAYEARNELVDRVNGFFL